MEGKVLALTTAFLFGLNPVVLKLGFARGGRSDAALFVGLAVTIPIFVLVSPFLGGLSFHDLSALTIGAFILGGLFGSGIGRRWMYIAIDRMGASPAAAIKNSAPVVTTCLAVLVLGEQVGLRQWVSVALIVSGIILVTWQRGAGVRRLIDVGLLAALGSALSYGIRPLFLEFGLDKADVPMTAAFIGALAAFAYASAFTRPSMLRGEFAKPSIRFFAAGGVLQAFGFLALTFGLSAGDVSVVYPVTSTAPLFTVIFTALLLRNTERLSARIVVGAAAVVGGVAWI